MVAHPYTYTLYAAAWTDRSILLYGHPVLVSQFLEILLGKESQCPLATMESDEDAEFVFSEHSVAELQTN